MGYRGCSALLLIGLWLLFCVLVVLRMVGAVENDTNVFSIITVVSGFVLIAVLYLSWKGESGLR